MTRLILLAITLASLVLPHQCVAQPDSLWSRSRILTWDYAERSLASADPAGRVTVVTQLTDLYLNRNGPLINTYSPEGNQLVDTVLSRNSIVLDLDRREDGLLLLLDLHYGTQFASYMITPLDPATGIPGQSQEVGDDWNHVSHVQAITGNHAIVLGFHAENGQPPFVRRYDQNLELVWAIDLPQPSEWFHLVDLLVLPTGIIVAAIQRSSLPGDPISLYALNFDGDLLWTSEPSPYEEGSGPAFAFGGLTPAPGGFIAVTRTPGNSTRLLVMDPNGSLLERVVLEEDAAPLNRVDVLPDGRVLAYSRGEGWDVRCYSPNGDFLWTRDYAPGRDLEQVWDVTLDETGHPYVAGRYYDQEFHDNVYVSRVESVPAYPVFAYLYPQSPDTLHPGDSLLFSARVVNTTSLSLIGMAGTMVQGPQGGVQPLISRPFSIDPSTTLTVPLVHHDLPPGLVPGTYTYQVQLNVPGTRLTFADSFHFVVTLPPGANGP